MGKRAMAPPKSTATISRVIAPNITLVLKTNFKPSFKLSKIGSPIFGFKMGFTYIKDKNNIDKVAKPKMINMEPCTPNQTMANPANAGPNTDAICQTELLQVAALA